MLRRSVLLASSCALLVAPGARASLASRLDAPLRAAGPHTGAQVVDLDTGRVLYARRAATGRLPGSVQKLWTTATVLRRFGASATLKTVVLTVHRPRGGVVHGNLYLHGGGDPNLGAKDIGALALQIRRLGVRRVTEHVVGDESRFDARRGGPSSAFGFSAYVEPLSALSYARNMAHRRYVRSPPLAAARALTRALGRAGVVVQGGRAGVGRTPAGTRRLAVIGSPPIRTLIALTNRPSDNFFAETLLKDLGASFGAGGTTAAGAGVVRAQAAAFGLHPRILDGSGLSRADRTSPRQITGLLRAMRGSAVFRASLARFGRRGDTLEDRLRGTYAARACAAKTGSLLDASALAGYCVARSGHLLAFGIFMNYIGSVEEARDLQDRMITELLRPTGGGAPARP